jgi:hypothetical protein
MDLMLAASAVGPSGKAIGIDMTEPMAERARFDPFGGTSEERVARKYGVRGVNLHAVRS